MDRKRIENIIILILILLNVFLLSVTISDRAAQRRADRETAETVTALLEADGITVSPGAALLQETPAICTVTRDFGEELARMDAVLGSTTYEDLGGSIRFYRSENGQAVLRGTGEIDMLLTGDSVRIRGSREKNAEKLFADAGVSLSLWTESETDNDHISCCCIWDGIPVYNAKLGFDYTGNSLSMVGGVMVLSHESRRSTEDVMDSVSALIRFLEIVHSEGLICSRLESVTPGYLMSVTVPGESTLTPIWHIVTDTGELYLNAVSGKTETVE